MYVVGVDENGLGPRLGPLVATALVIEVERYDVGRLRSRGMRLGITDSKATSGFGRMAWAEGVALAIVEKLTGAVPCDADALFGALSLDGLETMREPCPDADTSRQCFGAPIALPAYGGDVADGRRALASLEGRGVLRIVRARSALSCVARLNREHRAGTTKLAVDLHLFERLLLDARDAVGSDVTAICGMIGGIREYPRFARHVPSTSYAETARTKGRSAYRVDGIGDVSFEVDADAGHLPVALASIVGKYVRELAMDRIGRFYLAENADLPRPSGYHDPVTTRFIEGTETRRLALSIVDECFRRLG